MFVHIYASIAYTHKHITVVRRERAQRILWNKLREAAAAAASISFFGVAPVQFNSFKQAQLVVCLCVLYRGM